MSGFLGVPVGAAYHLVSALTSLLTPVAGGLAAVAAIVVFTAAVRLLLSPLSLRALRGQAAMARLMPQVQALRTRYSRQPERFNHELSALYKREGTGPFAGFLPLLAQWPFLSVMYLLFRSATVNGTPNHLLSDGLFGVPLGAHWLSGVSLLSMHDAVFVAVLAILAALCWLSARLAKRTAPAAAAPAAGASAVRGGGQAPAAPPRVGGSRGGAVRSGGTRMEAPRAANYKKPRGAGGPPALRGSADPAAALADSQAAGLLARVLPYVTVAIAAFAPLAAAIYLLTTAAWTLAERRLFLRRAARASGALAPETR